MDTKSRKPPTELALKHFDDHYKNYFGSEWHSIRLALLSKPKFCALVNNFSDKEAIIQELTDLGCLSIREEYHNMCFEKNLVPNEIENSNPAKTLRSIIQKDGNTPVIPGRKETVYEHSKDEAFEDIKDVSMSKEEAEGRFVHPDNIVMGGKMSVSMYEFVPSESTVGMEDFIEEEDYYSTYAGTDSGGFPIQTKDEGVIPFPKKLDAFTFPSGNFSHFQVSVWGGGKGETILAAMCSN